MARIGINGFSFVPASTGGSEIYFRILVDALQRGPADHEFLVFVRRGLAGELPVADPRFRLVRVREPRRATNVARARLGRPLSTAHPAFRAAMNAAALDLAHFPYGVLTPGEVETRKVLTLHDIQHEFFPEFFDERTLAARRRTYGGSIENADHVIASSEFTRRTLVERLGTPPEKVTTVHIAAPALPPPGRSRSRLPARYLFYPAASWPHKNHVRLLEAFAPHARDRRDLHLVLTGLAMQGVPAVEEAVRRLGLGDRVTHLGYVTAEQLADLFANALALVFPSLFEGFGLPLLEAMAAGCPIAASTATSVPEVAGDAALYFDPLDVAEMSARIGELIASADLRADLAERGRRRLERFVPERMARETVAVYERVLGLHATKA